MYKESYKQLEELRNGDVNQFYGAGKAEANQHF